MEYYQEYAIYKNQCEGRTFKEIKTDEVNLHCLCHEKITSLSYDVQAFGLVNNIALKC